MGRPRGGLTTKIHRVADSAGRPLGFLLTPGQAADITSASDLLAGLTAKAVIADKGYDSRALRDLVERCFNKLKHFRRIATGFDRLDCHFMGALHLAATML